ncbi:hypothetical protein [Burkholderia anthina]|uniref:hypothetical protein n=1 Tax=Burkholderia anthina TaxID=179879 RepID=UPI001FC8A597|nr:hypothetical protein [Burkholderia anthina]
MSNEAAEPEAIQTVVDVRNEGRDYMRNMIRNAFGTNGARLAAAAADDLAYFGMMGFDDAFVSLQSGDPRSMEKHMAQLTDALVALGEARATPARKTASRQGQAAAKRS